MSKAVVIGDIHGRSCWRTIVERETDADLFIFLGDYVSTHERISEKDQINNLLDILSYKEENPDRVILLRGNHDLQHMGYYWAECSGFFRAVEREMSKPEIRNRYLRDTQWVYIMDDIVFSHAGITERWFRDSGCKTIEEINTLDPSELFGFRPCKMSDYYGISQTQGPTWIRPWALADYAIPGWTWVVGHTTSKKIFNFKDEMVKDHGDMISQEEIDKTPNIWLCDTLPNEYLVIENGEFKPIEI